MHDSGKDSAEKILKELASYRAARNGNRHIECTDELIRLICTAIQGGASPAVAARAYGVGYQKHRGWITKPSKPEHIKYSDAVYEALAEAMIRAEHQVHHDDPKAWLMKGPGKAKAWGEDRWGDQQASLQIKQQGEAEGSARIIVEFTGADPREADDQAEE